MLIVILLTVLAIVIPNFVAFLNIVGSLGTCTLGFILPPIYYMKVFWSRISKFTVAFNIFIMLFGVGGGAYSIYESIKSLLKS